LGFQMDLALRSVGTSSDHCKTASCESRQGWNHRQQPAIESHREAELNRVEINHRAIAHRQQGVGETCERNPNREYTP
jgi:hypothetical protein